MKKAFILIISILSFIAIQSTAQGRYNGYVITNENDTVYGVVEFGNPALQAVRVTFTDYEVHEPVQLEPFQIKRYYANNQTFQSKIYDLDEGLDYGYAVFMEVIEDGAVTFYKYWNNDKRRFEKLLEDAKFKATTDSVKKLNVSLDQPILSKVDAAIEWIEKAYNNLKDKEKFTKSEKNVISRSVDFLATLYSFKRDKSRGKDQKAYDEFDAKYNFYDKLHDKYQ